MTPSKKLLYTTTANIIFLFHTALVLIVCLGWLFPSFFYIFIVFLVATALSEIFLGYCFLTKWEFYLRRKMYPEKVFDSSCIFHYGRVVFGLPPRPTVNKKEAGFFKKYSSLLILLLPLAGSLLVKFFNF